MTPVYPQTNPGNAVGDPTKLSFYDRRRSLKG